MPSAKFIRMTEETIAQLDELRYKLKLTFAAIIEIAVDEYYQRITAEKEEETQS